MAVAGVVTSVSAAPAFTTTVGPHHTLSASPTATPATCVTGVPAVRPTDGAFPIPFFASVTPAADGTAIASHYMVDSAWIEAHGISGHNVSLRYHKHAFC